MLCTLSHRLRATSCWLPSRWPQLEFTPPGLQFLSFCCTTVVFPQRLRQKEVQHTYLSLRSPLPIVISSILRPRSIIPYPVSLPVYSPPSAPSRHFVIVSSYTAHTLRHSLTNPFIAPQTLPSFPPDPWRTLFPLRRDAKSPENVSGKSPHGCARCVKR